MHKNSKTVLKEKCKANSNFRSPDFKTYFKAALTKMAFYSLKDKQIDQFNRMSFHKPMNTYMASVTP